MLTNEDLNRLEELSVFRSENDGELVRELVKMARRYQHVWQHMYVLDEANTGRYDDPSYYADGEALDAAIDAAINSQRKEGGEG